MHPSVIKSIVLFRDEYLKQEPGLSILDVGSAEVSNAGPTIRSIFGEVGCKYTGLDIEEAPEVDVVYNGRVMPFEDNSFDAVIATSSFEHIEFFWEVFSEMCRVSRKWIYVNAPSAGNYHAFPVDCWRFYLDSGQALAKWGNVELVKCWIDEESLDWKDFNGIWRK